MFASVTSRPSFNICWTSFFTIVRIRLKKEEKKKKRKTTSIGGLSFREVTHFSRNVTQVLFLLNWPFLHMPNIFYVQLWKMFNLMNAPTVCLAPVCLCTLAVHCRLVVTCLFKTPIAFQTISQFLSLCVPLPSVVLGLKITTTKKQKRKKQNRILVHFLNLSHSWPDLCPLVL